ncbi:MAG: hypothetical protein WAQ15_10850, partial [Bacillota bacterium]
ETSHRPKGIIDFGYLSLTVRSIAVAQSTLREPTLCRPDSECRLYSRFGDHRPPHGHMLY